MSQPQAQFSSIRGCNELRQLGELFFAAVKFCDVRNLYRNNRRQFSWPDCGRLREGTLWRLLPSCRQFLSEHADMLKSLGLNVFACEQRLDRISRLAYMQLADDVPIAWQMEFQAMADHIGAVRIGFLSPLDSSAQDRSGDAETLSSIAGYVPADTLFHDEGIQKSRLSEAASNGKVQKKKAPTGMLDTQGRKIRLLYNREEAIKHCKPKHVKKKTIQKLARKT